MSEHLEKAKNALEAARDQQPHEAAYGYLLEVAKVQAEVAQAEALCSIADLLAEASYRTIDGKRYLRTVVTP